MKEDFLVYFFCFQFAFMKHILQFHVWKDEKWYIASGADLPIVTQGRTLDELTKNLQEAIELYFEGEDLESEGIAHNPSILVTFELPTKVQKIHAKA